MAVVLGDETSAARNARAAALLEHGFKTLEWKSLVPTARVENLPSNIVGASFQPNTTMLEHWKACQDLPPPVTADAGKDGKNGKKQHASLTETKKPVQRQARSSGSKRRRHARNE